MVYSLSYRRPPHVDSTQASVIGDEKAKSIGESTVDSVGTGMSMGIPEALSFDRIIGGGTCPVSKLFHSYFLYLWILENITRKSLRFSRFKREDPSSHFVCHVT